MKNLLRILFVFFGLSLFCPYPVLSKDATDKVNYSDLSSEIVKEINLARKDPKKYAAFIKEFKKNYDGKNFKRLGKKTIATHGGAGIADEAIGYLMQVQPQPPLNLMKGMSLGAKDHVLDIVLTKVTGHQGTDGSFPGDRISRFGTWKDAVGENICYGFDTAREIVMWLIIDDGMSDRSHRINIFRSEFHIAGVHLAEHPLYDFICVITFAGEFEEKEQESGLKN